MRKTLTCVAIVAALTAISVGSASAAPLRALTVRGYDQTETYVDANRNGQADPGDYVLVTGRLAGVSLPTSGSFEARITFTGQGSLASISGRFDLSYLGTLQVAGITSLENGPPVGLRVVGTTAVLRNLMGATLNVFDESDNSALFTFQQQGRSW